MTEKTKWRNGILAKIRANRRGLRARGLTPADVLALEAIAAVAPTGSRRLSIAAIGRLLGVSRVSAWRRVQRLKEVGALLPFKMTVALNVRGLLRWTEQACRDRLAAVKRRFSLAKAEKVTHGVTHNRMKDKKEAEKAEFFGVRVGDRLPDGRSCVGFRKFGLAEVPVWV